MTKKFRNIEKKYLEHSKAEGLLLELNQSRDLLKRSLDQRIKELEMAQHVASALKDELARVDRLISELQAYIG